MFKKLKTSPNHDFKDGIFTSLLLKGKRSHLACATKLLSKDHAVEVVSCLLFPSCCPTGFGFTTAAGSARCPAPVVTIAAVAAVPVVVGGKEGHRYDSGEDRDRRRHNGVVCKHSMNVVNLELRRVLTRNCY